jgi:3-carboxy-cis,cis-muconate cycloisomerase
MVKLVAKRLDLPVPTICMHHRTDRFTELGLVLANLLATLGELGMEIRDLARSEVAEVAEPWGVDRHSSSTMPQKQNPEVSEWLEGLAQLGRGYAMSLLDIRQQHERDTSRVPSEFHALPNLLLHTIAAVDAAIFVLQGLKVDPERMRENTLRNGGLIMSEALMLLLAKRSRRKVWAHQHCHNISMRVAQEGGDLADAMSADPEVTRYLSGKEIREACKPEQYIGTAMQQVDRTTSACERRVSAALKLLRAALK